jgi:tRNA threonylcarbamoyladenosine modification (KEOPS) complex Cgi121 subunit
MVNEYKRSCGESVAAGWDVFADCMVQLGAEEGKHFVDFRQVESEAAIEMNQDESVDDMTSANCKSTRPNELELNQVKFLNVTESLIE